MKNVARCLLLTIIIAWGVKTNCSAKNFKKLQDIHKRVNDELIGIRKDFSATQPRIYSLLDQLDTMKRIAEEMRAKKISFKQKYSELTKQVTMLSDKNSALKIKLKTTTDDFEKALQTLAQEQQTSDAMKKELFALQEEKRKKEEQEKIAGANTIKPLAEEKVLTPENALSNQSFNLTSSSDPTSPR